LPAHLVLMNDVALEMDGPAGGPQRFQPGRVIFLGVFQQADGISGNQRRTGRAGEDLLRQLRVSRAVSLDQEGDWQVS